MSFWIISGSALFELKKSCASLQMNSVAPATLSARKTQLSCYYRFCRTFGLGKFPCSDYQLALYVAHLCKFMVSTSIANYVQGVIFAHKLKGILPPSVSSPAVKMTLQGVKRVKPGGDRIRDPITIRHLSKFYSVLNCDLKLHHMLWACYLLLFRSLLRVSHVTESPHTLLAEDVKLTEGGLLIYVQSSKSSQFKGSPHIIPVACVSDVKLCAVCWLRSWLRRRKPLPKEPVFSLCDGSPMSYNSFQKYLKQIVTKAGITKRISSHSFRKGGATFLSSIGVPIQKIKERGNWSSDAVFKYLCEPLHVKIAQELKVASVFDMCS